MAHTLSGFTRNCYADLLEAYNRAWNSPDVACHADAVAKAVSSPQPRHWISPSEAARNIQQLERGRKPYVIRGTNKYYALMSVYEAYKRLRASRFRSESISFVVAFACLEPAPRFFLSKDRARRIIEKLRNGEYVL